MVTLATVHGSLIIYRISKPWFRAFLHLEDAKMLGEVQEMGKMDQVCATGLDFQSLAAKAPRILVEQLPAAGRSCQHQTGASFRHKCVIAASLSSMKGFKKNT